MRDPFRQTWRIGQGPRRMACSLRQGAGNIWTATYWCGSSNAYAQTLTAQPTTPHNNAAGIRLYSMWPCLRLSLRTEEPHAPRHKETRWAASSSNPTDNQERETALNNPHPIHAADGHYTRNSCMTLLWLHHNHKMPISYHKNGLVSSHQSAGSWLIFMCFVVRIF